MEENIRKILSVAVTAPSGDNSQPWWFHIDGNKLEVHLYPDKDNKILNFELSGSHIAMGALIENIAILANNEGYSSAIKLFPVETDSNLVAIIVFTEQNLPHDLLAESMPLRCTNRKPYNRKQISDDILRDIESSGDVISGSAILLTTNKSEIKELGNASSVMERVALETEAIHKLFFESIVWSEKEESEKGMGLPIKTTELPPPIQLLFRAIKHWKVAKALNHIGLSFLASKANAQTYGTAQAIGVIVADKFTKDSYVNAGRIFQRTWLTATKHDLAFQPVTGVLFLGQRIVANKTEVFHEYHIPMIQNAYNTIHSIFKITNSVPAMLFRIGYAEAPTARTIRKPAEIR